MPPLNTYAILDAAKVVNFVEMLEASGLEHRCLFKGEAAAEMRDVAPYVVRLKEDVDFTRNLFSKDYAQEVPWFMWDKEPGIYVRSRGSLEDMWKHFRKFTKVQDENGKWFYFRFWESFFLNTFLMLSKELAAYIFTTENALGIQTLITRSGSRITDIRFSSTQAIPKKPFILTSKILDALDIEIQGRNLQADIQHVMACLTIKGNEERKSLSDGITRDRDWLMENGFSDQDLLRKLLVIFAKSGGLQSLPSAAKEILSNKQTGPSARLWLFEKNMGEVQ